MRAVIIFFIASGLIFSSCNEDEDPALYGNLALNFNHLVHGDDLEVDQMIYENAAGNAYEVTNIQWFISDLTLVRESGEEILIRGDDWIHYVDTDLPETHTWEIQQQIPAGDYTSVKFTFGIKGEKNEPYMFTDPPESNMIWPYHMGGDEGGYHYMKLNGFWIDLNQEKSPFNFHIGVGQIYDDNGDVVEFVQNWFEDELVVNFTVDANQRLEADFNMNIENWFRDPHVYDHNEYGGKIMNNQEAMGKISDNGMNVFTISFPATGADI